MEIKEKKLANNMSSIVKIYYKFETSILRYSTLIRLKIVWVKTVNQNHQKALTLIKMDNYEKKFLIMVQGILAYFSSNLMLFDYSSLLS